MTIFKLDQNKVWIRMFENVAKNIADTLNIDAKDFTITNK